MLIYRCSYHLLLYFSFSIIHLISYLNLLFFNLTPLQFHFTLFYYLFTFDFLSNIFIQIIIKNNSYLFIIIQLLNFIQEFTN